MKDEKIDEMKEKLIELILTNANYKEIYTASTDLDELIAKKYKTNPPKKEVC